MCAKSCEILLNERNSLKRYNEIAFRHDDVKITMTSGIYVVDGHSILGVMSLDNSTPNTVLVESEDMSKIDAFIAELEGADLLV